MRALLVLVVIALPFAGCLNKADDDAAPVDNQTSSTPAPSMNMSMTATIELGESGGPAPGAPSFGPNSMYLKATGMDALVVGMPVNITIKNAGGIVHNVVIDELSFNSGDIPAGQTKSVTLTPTKDGTFEMYCDKGFNDPAGTGVATHRGAGMVGKATVKKA